MEGRKVSERVCVVGLESLRKGKYLQKRFLSTPGVD